MSKTSKKRTIILADDHPMFRSGVRRELEQEGTFTIVAETDDGNQALALIRQQKPDCAVLDFQMLGLTGIEIVEQLNAEESPVKTILLTMHNEKKILLRAMEAGFDGYVLKNDAVLDIVNAVNTVVAGESFISPKLRKILGERSGLPKNSAGTAVQTAALTPSEKKMLLLIADLHSNDEIAKALFLSRRTVENQRVLLSRKLSLGSARELLKYAVKNKTVLP